MLPEVVSSAGFECSLAPDSAGADFGVALDVVQARELVVALSSKALPLVDSDPRYSEWLGVRDLCKAWGDPRSSLHDVVTRIFLEFDTSDEITPSAPGIFVSLEDAAWRDPASSSRLARDAVDSVRRSRMPAREFAVITRCLASLPPSGLLLHVGVMLSRLGCPLRLCVWLPATLLQPYLERLGVPFEPEAASLVRRIVWEGRSAITAQLTIRDDIATRVDVEVGLASCLRHPMAWRQSIARLFSEGLCAEQKLAAIERWPRVISLGQASDESLTLLRDFSHFKVTLEPGAKPRAKAYFTLVRLVTTQSR